MTTGKSHARRETNKKADLATRLFFSLIFGGGALIIALSFRTGENVSIQALCIFYALIASLFLVAQLVGFVLSQTDYSDRIERAKFALLENEEKEWQRERR